MKQKFQAWMARFHSTPKMNAKDFERIHQMACDVGNAILAKASESEIDALNAKLLTEVDAALAKFGDSADLLAIKADFLHDPKRAIPLLERALAIAISQKDGLNVFLIGDSLLRLFNEGKDEANVQSIFDVCDRFAKESLLTNDDAYQDLKEFYETERFCETPDD